MQHDIYLKPPIKKFRPIVPQLAHFPANLRPIIRPVPATARFFTPYRRRELRHPLLHLRLEAALRHERGEEPLRCPVDFKVDEDRAASADAGAVGFDAELDVADDVGG